jgi:hypothetical protein
MNQLGAAAILILQAGSDPVRLVDDRMSSVVFTGGCCEKGLVPPQASDRVFSAVTPWHAV